MRTVLLLALIFLVACSQQSPTASFVKSTDAAKEVSAPKETPAGPSCAEDDGGDNPAERGTTKGLDASGKQFEYVDECVGTILAENYCDGVQPKTANKRCAKSCERGQCWN